MTFRHRNNSSEQHLRGRVNNVLLWPFVLSWSRPLAWVFRITKHIRLRKTKEKQTCVCYTDNIHYRIELWELIMTTEESLIAIKHCSLASPILIHRLLRTSLTVSTPCTIHPNCLTDCLPASLTLWILTAAYRFCLVKRLWISWFLRLRVQKFMITITIKRIGFIKCLIVLLVRNSGLILCNTSCTI